MSDRQRRLLGILLLFLGIGVSSSQALLTSCSSSATAALTSAVTNAADAELD